jgi:hypothetical protein
MMVSQLTRKESKVILMCQAQFEVLTVVVIRNSVFCDIKPRSPVNINGRFRGTYLIFKVEE